MVDVHDRPTRSRNMAAIRGSNTKPEIIVRKALHGRGFRFRLHDKRLPGKPDLVFAKYRAVLFVHGCFWHGHSCPAFHWPATREVFWRDKIGATMARDTRNRDALLAAGWRVGVIWECALLGKGRLGAEVAVAQVGNWLSSKRQQLSVVGHHEDCGRDKPMPAGAHARAEPHRA